MLFNLLVHVKFTNKLRTHVNTLFLFEAYTDASEATR